MEDHPFPMVVLEAPKRDSRGRIVNEEDAEARAAAKEQRRQRDAANKAAAEERKRQAAQALLEAQAAPDRAEEKPARKRRRRRGKSASQEVQAVQPPQVPTQEPGHRGKLTRPGARMETGSAMPRTEFDRPDPCPGTILWMPPPVCWPPASPFRPRRATGRAAAAPPPEP